MCEGRSGRGEGGDAGSGGLCGGDGGGLGGGLGHGGGGANGGMGGGCGMDLCPQSVQSCPKLQRLVEEPVPPSSQTPSPARSLTCSAQSANALLQVQSS